MLTCSLIHTHWICSHVLWTFKPLSRSTLIPEINRLAHSPGKQEHEIMPALSLRHAVHSSFFAHAGILSPRMAR